MLKLILSLLSFLTGKKIVPFQDQRALQQQTYDLTHAQLSRETGKPWKRSDRLNG